jgi:hypothetical protein
MHKIAYSGENFDVRALFWRLGLNLELHWSSLIFGLVLLIIGGNFISRIISVILVVSPYTTFLGFIRGGLGKEAT